MFGYVAHGLQNQIALRTYASSSTEGGTCHENLLQEFIVRVFDQVQKLIRKGITIFLQKVLALVRDIMSIMRNSECRVGETRLGEPLLVLLRGELREQFVAPTLVRAGGESTLLVQEGEHT